MQNTIEAEVEVKFHIPGMPADEREVAYPIIEITYNFTPARAAYTPRGEYGPIDPPEPADVELVGVKLINGDGLAPDYEQLRGWAQDWLDGAGYERACDAANDARYAMRNVL